MVDRIDHDKEGGCPLLPRTLSALFDLMSLYLSAMFSSSQIRATGLRNYEWIQDVKWIKRLVPKGSEVRIPDLTVTPEIVARLVTTADPVRLHTVLCYFKLQGHRCRFPQPPFNGPWGLWDTFYCIHASSMS